MTGDRHLVLLAHDRYKDLAPLKCPVNDADAVGDVLMRPGVGNFNRQYRLTNGETVDSVRRGLTQLFGNAAPGDTILFYFSGHGLIESRDLSMYLALAESRPDKLRETALALSELMSMAARSSCDNIVLVLDCCYSGSVADIMPGPGVNQPLLAAAGGQTIYVMTSSTSMEPSWEKEGEKLSVFTGFLVSGLETGRADRDNDGLVTVDEAFAYARNLVVAAGRQQPLRFNYNVRADLVLTNNPYFRPLDPYQVPADQIGKFQAVRTMIEFVKLEEDNEPLPDNFSRFLVSMPLGNYYIEGVPVRASGLSVSFAHTPNIVQTQDGFECDAFFPPLMLSDEMKEGKEILGGLCRVRMRVPLDDILYIFGTRRSDGAQLNLYTGKM